MRALARAGTWGLGPGSRSEAGVTLIGVWCSTCGAWEGRAGTCCVVAEAFWVVCISGLAAVVSGTMPPPNREDSGTGLASVLTAVSCCEGKEGIAVP